MNLINYFQTSWKRTQQKYNIIASFCRNVMENNTFSFLMWFNKQIAIMENKEKKCQTPFFSFYRYITHSISMYPQYPLNDLWINITHDYCGIYKDTFQTILQGQPDPTKEGTVSVNSEYKNIYHKYMQIFLSNKKYIGSSWIYKYMQKIYYRYNFQLCGVLLTTNTAPLFITRFITHYKITTVRNSHNVPINDVNDDDFVSRMHENYFVSKKNTYCLQNINIPMDIKLCSRFFISVEYSHPKMKNWIPIEISKYYLYGNHILSKTFLYYYMKYNVREKYILDDEYTLTILDKNFETFTLDSKHFILLHEKYYSVQRIDTASLLITNTNT
jgi:hypothetical protein